MRILFTSVPAYGHLLPLLPLLAAARRAGHDTALLTHPSMQGVAPSVRLLPAGPDVPDTIAEVARRTGSGAVASDLALAPAFFVEARMALGARDALAAARTFDPAVVVADMLDFPGQFAAAALGVPWAAHGSTTVLPAPVDAALEAALAPRFRQLGVGRTRPTSFVDPWPRSLLRPTDAYPAERIAVRPEPHSGEGPRWTRPRFAGGEDRPLVLVTLGTVVDAPEVVDAILASLSGLDVNVLVAPVAADAAVPEVDHAHVQLADFVPMADLLPDVDVMVASGGAGTVLSGLGAGLPLVLLPMGLDKPDNAARAAAVGAARVVATPQEVGAAVDKVLGDPGTALAARAVAAEIALMNAPDDALRLVLQRATAGSWRGP